MAGLLHRCGYQSAHVKRRFLRNQNGARLATADKRGTPALRTAIFPLCVFLAERVKTQGRYGYGESISPSRSSLVIGRESISVMPRERNSILSANFESGFSHALLEFCKKVCSWAGIRLAALSRAVVQADQECYMGPGRACLTVSHCCTHRFPPIRFQPTRSSEPWTSR
jgi:hypothetical protein